MSAPPVAPAPAMPLGGAARTAWDRLAARERRLVLSAAALAAAVALALGVPAMLEAADQARTRTGVLARQVAAARAALDALPRAPDASPQAPGPAAARAQAALLRSGLTGVSVASRGSRVTLRAESVAFDAVVDVLERLQREERLHVVQARFFALSAPGQVRAEVELAP